MFKKIVLLALFLGTVVFINVWHQYSRTLVDVERGGLTSDSMTQCMPIHQLKREPLKTIWYMHKKPPLLDVIRVAIAQFYPDDALLVKHVDEVLYVLFSILAGVSVTLICFWLWRIIGPKMAIVAAMAWAISPATILYTVVLDTVYLASIGLLWFFYELWKIRNNEGSILRISLAVVYLYYAKEFFQWYFVLIVLASLILLKVPWKKIMVFVGIACICIFPYVIKQKIMYDTMLTTSFSGWFKAGVIWYKPTSQELEEVSRTVMFKYPKEAERYSGNDQWNNQKMWTYNQVVGKIATREIKKRPTECIYNLLVSIILNVTDYFKTPDFYCGNEITWKLPWKNFYHFIFSGWRWLALILVAVVVYTKRGAKLRSSLAMLLPALVVGMYYLLGNTSEYTEVVRLRFILEPVLYMFIVCSLLWKSKKEVKV